MVQIKPFTGLRYADAALEAVTAPPYDVISPSQQDELYAKHPQNIVRLILGKQLENDTDTNNVYSRAAETLASWRTENALLKEDQPAIYAYAQSWTDSAGKKTTRYGFLSLVRIAPYEKNIVLPHEFTLSGPKTDRLNLTRATQTTLSPIFLLYNDPETWVEKNVFNQTFWDKALNVTDPDGVLHTFLPVTDAEIIGSITQLMTPQQVIIADGHHRYETSLTYQKEKREQATDAPEGSLPCDYTLAFFTNTSSPGLKVYPTHRIIKHLPEGVSSSDFLAQLEEIFIPSTHPEMTLFWLQAGNNASKQALQLKPGVDISMLPQPLQELDVAIIDKLVFENILKTDANTLKQNGDLAFVRDEAEVEALLKSGEGDLPIVFYVHAPDTHQIEAICKSGFRMPQKSTYFYPKLLSGLVLYSHLDN